MYYYFLNKNTREREILLFSHETKKSFICTDPTYKDKRIINKANNILLKKSETASESFESIIHETAREATEKLYSVTNLYKEIKEEEEKWKKQLFLMAVEERGLVFIFDDGTIKLYKFASYNITTSIAFENKRFSNTIYHSIGDNIFPELAKKFKLSKRGEFSGYCSQGIFYYDLSILKNKLYIRIDENNLKRFYFKNGNNEECLYGTIKGETVVNDSFFYYGLDRCFFSISELSENGISYSDLIKERNEDNPSDNELIGLIEYYDSSFNYYSNSLEKIGMKYLFKNKTKEISVNFANIVPLLDKFRKEKSLITIILPDIRITFLKETVLNNLILKGNDEALLEGIEEDNYSKQFLTFIKGLNGTYSEIKMQIKSQLTRDEYRMWELKNEVM